MPNIKGLISSVKFCLRQNLDSTVIFATLFLLGGCTSEKPIDVDISTGALAVKKSNIIVILADDLGIGDLTSYNPNSKIPTPNLDLIAKQGMRFTDAHTPSSVCTPTRYGLLTGRYAWRSRLKEGVLWGYDPALIEEGRSTIGSLLQREGYQTAAIGKWHLGLGNKEVTDYSQALIPGPISQGFDYFYGIPASLDMVPYVYIENGHVVAQPTKTIAGSEKARNGGAGYWRDGPAAPNFKHIDVLPTIANKTIEYINDNATADKPFFIYMPLPAPHTPWLPKEKYQGKSNAGVYGDFVVQVDDVIGQVYKALSDNGIADNTLVIITSDNGAHWEPKDIEKYDHRANGKYRGDKADIWEGGHRVPFIVTWPGKVPQNSTSDEILSLVDVYATISSLIGGEMPNDQAEDSFDMSAVLLGNQSVKSVRKTTIFHSLLGMFSIRRGDWKFIDGVGHGGFGGKKAMKNGIKGQPAGQLYNLADDPQEQQNLYLKYPKKVALLKAELELHKKQGATRFEHNKT